jgi:hypothetical protein
MLEFYGMHPTFLNWLHNSEVVRPRWRVHISSSRRRRCDLDAYWSANGIRSAFHRAVGGRAFYRAEGKDDGQEAAVWPCRTSVNEWNRELPPKPPFRSSFSSWPTLSFSSRATSCSPDACTPSTHNRTVPPRGHRWWPRRRRGTATVH